MTDERSGDLLARATRALRDQASAAGAADGPTGPWQVMDGWSGLIRGMRRTTRRRRLFVLGGLQVALALGGLGAWAAVSGRLPALFSETLLRAIAPAPAAPEGRRRGPRRATAAPAVAQAAPAAVEAPVAAEAPAPVEAASASAPAPRPTLPAPRRARAMVALPDDVPPAEAPPSADALYEDAHFAHFVRKDYAAALQAWDRYLALGAATFTPEARYNRAIALVRLGRREEAAAALRPFAASDYGGYRAREARDLLRMLDAPP